MRELAIRILLIVVSIVSIAAMSSLKHAPKVVVTGLGTKTGQMMLHKLLQRKAFHAVALVDDARMRQDLVAQGVPEDQVHVVDLLHRDKDDTDTTHALREAFHGASKVLLCNSAPQLPHWTFTIANALRSLVGLQRPPLPHERRYLPGVGPDEVDFQYNKRVVDLSLAHHVDHIVYVATMGGYRGRHLPNCSMPVPVDPGLRQRRALERYLMKRVKCTILHAAHIDREQPPHPREVVCDADDALLRTQFRHISRAEVCEVALQALLNPAAIQRSIDIAAGPRLPGPGPQDWIRFWARPGNCLYPAA